MKGKKTILILLAVFWAAIITYNARSFFAPEGLEHAKEGKDVRPSPGQDAARVRLDLLGEKHPPYHAYQGVRKDIFSPLLSPPKPVEVTPPAVEEPKPVVPTPLEAFLKDIRFMGFVEKGDKKTIFLARGTDVFLVKKGDIIDKRFLMAKITSAKLTVKDLIKEEEGTMELVK
ncbi:MAG: hypothetical protein HY883_07075 [Deltaproteobacteria bacterium]|nr:hypothetical protein [Deltaproteobacteria bacterium]